MESEQKQGRLSVECLTFTAMLQEEYKCVVCFYIFSKKTTNMDPPNSNSTCVLVKSDVVPWWSKAEVRPFFIRAEVRPECM